MNLDEARKLLLDERNNQLKEDDFFVVDEDEREDYVELVAAIINLLCDSRVERVKAKKELNNNSLVIDFKKHGIDFYHINTVYGKSEILSPYLLFDRDIPFTPIVGKCYDNSLISVRNMSASINPKILTGIFNPKYFNDSKPIIHAITEFTSKRYGVYVIDYNLNLVMSKKLYCKIFNFNVLSSLDKEKVEELVSLFFECKNHTKGRKDADNIHYSCYMELAPEAYEDYIYQVLENKRYDDYDFGTEIRKLEKKHS